MNWTDQINARIFSFGCWIIGNLPQPLKTLTVKTLTQLWYNVLRIRRRTVENNIRDCYPEWNSKQVQDVAKATFVNQCQMIVDFGTMSTLKKSDVGNYVNLKNQHILEDAVRDHGGALLLGLHLANGDFGIAALAAKYSNVSLIAKHFKSQWLDKFVYDVRHRFGLNTIHPRRSSFEILKALKNNGIVIFVLDQFMGPPQGVPTTFFGRPTGTAVALALFAEKTKKPVIPTYTTRAADGFYTVTFEKPIPFEYTGTKDETLQAMTQKYNDALESIVRRYPEQWLWLHRRWKPFNGSSRK